ncbi:acylphosphatase [soil metagenome]
MTERRHIRIRGHVQGVFFRDSTRKTAQQAGATGWVANRPDGSVEVEVQGSCDAVGAVEEFCRTGPPRATVTGVEVSSVDPVEDEAGFTVR